MDKEKINLDKAIAMALVGKKICLISLLIIKKNSIIKIKPEDALVLLLLH